MNSQTLNMTDSMKDDQGTIKVTVRDETNTGGPPEPVVNAIAEVFRAKSGPGGKPSTRHDYETTAFTTGHTREDGSVEFTLPPAHYRISIDAFVDAPPKEVDLTQCGCRNVDFAIKTGFAVGLSLCTQGGREAACGDLIVAGTPVKVAVQADDSVRFKRDVEYVLSIDEGVFIKNRGHEIVLPWGEPYAILDTSDLPPGTAEVRAMLREKGSARIIRRVYLSAAPQPRQAVTGNIGVSLRRTATNITDDLALWLVIRESTNALAFDNYRRFVDFVLCGKPLPEEESRGLPEKQAVFERLERRRSLPFTDMDAYRFLKVATEAFVMVNCGVSMDGLKCFEFSQESVDELLRRAGIDGNVSDLRRLWHRYLKTVNGTADRTLPYLALIREKLGDVGLKNGMFAVLSNARDLPQHGFGIIREKLTNPCLLELIWSYWHEEGMQVQTMNAIKLRFQNRRLSDNDPLANMEIDPLRPLNNVLWGYVQDEQHRLTLQRRAYEYDHHYGLRLEGRAVPELRSADSRSKFIEAFHNLLHLCSVFYKEDDDTTVIADGFTVLNALKEVHRIIAEGAHNQFGDLPSTARIEMLMEQWLLARPEFREFLPTRIMVAYSEPWMDRVDAMKKLQGWTDSSIADFHELAVFGEQILLSIRFGSWSEVSDRDNAANWARFWRSEIQGYIHSYRAVTGVDLTSEFAETRLVREAYLPPSVHLRRRLDNQQGTGAADPAAAARATASASRNGQTRSARVRNGVAERH